MIPWAVLSRRQFAGFRSADWTSQGGSVEAVRFEAPEDLARIKPPLFPVVAAVVAGTKDGPPGPLPASGTRWTGRVPGRNATWAQVELRLTAAAADVTSTLDDLDGSPYRARFTQGATLLPSVRMRVERLPAPAFGMPAGRTAVQSGRYGLEKPPWKLLDTIRGVVEDQFIHPMHVGATIVPFRSRQPGHVVVPWSGGRLLSGTDPAIDAFDGLATWWRAAERHWQAGRSSKMSLLEQIDFQGKLRAQFPTPQHRVVYSASGQHLAACRLDNPAAIVEHKLYWGPAKSVDEARYLTTVLNSRSLAEAVLPLQSRGQHNPRDFDTHVFVVPFPLYDPSDAVHLELAALAERAEGVAAGVDVDAHRQFQRARRAVRDALEESGVQAALDEAVSELLAPMLSEL